MKIKNRKSGEKSPLFNKRELIWNWDFSPSIISKIGLKPNFQTIEVVLEHFVE